jgi:hypothetical protein
MTKLIPNKLLLLVVAISALSGCNASLGTNYEAIRAISNATTMPQGKSLGGGFVEGMTPEQACIHFKDHFRTPKNILCKNVGASDFANLTVVNRRITGSPNQKNEIKTIAFYFNANKKLALVQSVRGRDAYFNQKRSEWNKNSVKPSVFVKPRSPAKDGP